MDGDSRVKALLEIIEESQYLESKVFESLMLDKAPSRGQEVDGDRFLRGDILRDVCREEAMEVLHSKGMISSEQLRTFRKQILAERLGYLAEGATYAGLTVHEPSVLRDRARLYLKHADYYANRTNRYYTWLDALRPDLEYIEIVADKTVHDFPGLDLSETIRDVLERLVGVYEDRFEDVRDKFSLSQQQHAAKVRHAKEEIDQLYEANG